MEHGHHDSHPPRHRSEHAELQPIDREMLETMQRNREQVDPMGLYLHVMSGANLTPEQQLAYEGILENYQLKLRERDHYANLSGIDGLTKLPNRRAMDEKKAQLEAELHPQGRRRQELVGVLIASSDIIGLGDINDISPFVADELIRIVADTLSKQFRENTWFRRGGDEFIGIFALKEKEEAADLVLRLEQNAQMIYTTLRNNSSYPGLPEMFPVRCATKLYIPGGTFTSLDEAELAADPKTRGRDSLIEFSK